MSEIYSLSDGHTVRQVAKNTVYSGTNLFYEKSRTARHKHFIGIYSDQLTILRSDQGEVDVLSVSGGQKTIRNELSVPSKGVELRRAKPEVTELAPPAGPH